MSSEFVFEDSRKGLSDKDHLESLRDFAKESPGVVDPVRFVEQVKGAQRAFQTYLDSNGGESARDELRRICPALRDNLRAWTGELGDMVHGEGCPEGGRLFFPIAVHLGGHIEGACWVLFPEAYPGHQQLSRNGSGERFLRDAIENALVLLSRPEGSEKWWHEAPRLFGDNGQGSRELRVG